ncbi:ABC transporter ATP-binding protein [Paenibacillus sp. EC2-1]|uniref:ABC transporter ATP-binding protein n=1 Tax=Paenibacillus sp. EC2-1 TaxID=3388665 RepID=UPI003BEEE0E5
MKWSLVIIFRNAPIPASLLLLLNMLEGLAPALTIYVTQRLIDTVIQTAGAGSDAFKDVVSWIVALAATLILTSEILWRFRDPLNVRLRQKLNYSVGKERLEKATQLPLLFFEESSSYDRLERSKNPGGKVEHFFHYMLWFLQGIIGVVSIASLFWIISPWISIVLVAVVIPRALYEARYSNQWMELIYNQTEEQRRISYIDRLLTGRKEQKEIRLFGLSSTLIGRWKEERTQFRKTQLNKKRNLELSMLPSILIYYFVEVSIVILLAFFVSAKAITVGVFISLFQAVERMQNAAQQVSSGYGEMITDSIATGYVRNFLSEAGEGEKTTPHSEFPETIERGISLQDISFTYPGQSKPSLQHINLHLKKGELVALVGENGAGKSTLVKILLGLYKPTQGRILVDDIEYSDIHYKSMQQSVSACFQDFFNFEFTAAQSIAAGKGESLEDVSSQMQSIRQAANVGGADEFISNLSRGYDTHIGHLFHGGQGLSGGQWQRIAISRTMIRNPQLLILDEPTAALDPNAEANIYAQYTAAFQGKAVLLVSHRLGSARLADRIVVMQDGCIVEEGSHQELLDQKGVYSGMWEVQSQWYK